MADSSSTEKLALTPLHALHLRLGARMAPFAGYDMPIQYPAGVMQEHLHTRAAAGLFDVSHMGQVILRPRSGDVADAAHRAALAERVAALGRLDLLVHNASALGPSPLRPLGALGPAELTALWTTNVVAANALNTLLVPTLRTHDGILVSISSDAAVEHYENWGGYGASKAALDHLTLTWSTEAGVTGYAVDPGDMRTAMHQLAFPGEDISDRPLPQTVVPRLLALLDQRPPSGRYRAAAFAPALTGAPA